MQEVNNDGDNNNCASDGEPPDPKRASLQEYVSVMRETARLLGEDIDRISLEPLSLSRPEGGFRHESIPLIAAGCIQYWDTETLYSWCQNYCMRVEDWRHPVLRRSLDAAEAAYLQHYYECLQWEKTSGNSSILGFGVEYRGKVIESADAVRDLWVSQNGLIDDPEIRLAARALLGPNHFADHFCDFPPILGEIKWERLQAVLELSRAARGTWLLRYSSLNRPEGPNAAEKAYLLERLGIQFYAFSYKTLYEGRIDHILVLHRPGKGWAHITGVDWIEAGSTLSLTPTPSQVKFEVCFLDMLSYLMDRYGLRLSGVVSDYCEVSLR